MNPAPVSAPICAAVRRAAPALGVVLSAALLGFGEISRSGSRRTSGRARGEDGTPASSATAFAVALVILLLVPSLYVRARCRHDAARLTGLLEQSRFGEARALARDLLALAPELRWEGRPLRQAAADIERTTGALESRVAAALPAQATDARRLSRARDLAMLGRSGKALDVLQSLSGASTFAEACNLRGTIHETGGAWEAGREAYREAKRAWEAMPASSRRAAGLIRATTGIAYCERKLGRYREAEAAYRELLALAPTADSHFLLARFYEDVQQADKAQTHARIAMALAPNRYGQEGRKLIDKLTTLHFGCLGVFLDERGSSRASFDDSP
jgi:tetratricopeptide (TPR) repeat protein